MIRAYHFVGKKLRDGRPVPADGEWLVHEGPAVLCKSGLHASRHPFDALQCAPGGVLCLVECDDIVDEQEDKLVCRRRRIVARFDATDLLREFARICALSVIDKWKAPKVVRDYLETGDESLRDATRAAARAAAWDAAWYAASAAASAAAWDAAWDAARAAAWWDAASAAAMGVYREKFRDMADAKFSAMGVKP